MVFFQEAKPAREPIFRAPASVIGLIAVLAVAHVARVLAPAALSARIVNDYALDPAAYTSSAATWFDRVVPPFSHMLLHGSLMHVTVNCLWLLAFGPVVARRFGGPAFLLFFVLCGLGGAACFVAMDWGLNVGAIGASGAISGLMGAAIRMMRVREPYLNIATLPLMPLFSSQVLLFSAVWLVLNLLTGLFGGIVMGTIEPIAWQDHLGGYLAGLLLAGPFEYYVGLAARLRRVGA
jgi:membrane associated rhomboid family serine protease